jgi:hypothetical protein
MRIRVLAPFVLAASFVAAQTPSVSGKAQATGTCSLANTGSVTTVTFNCGIGKDQGDELIAILNKMFQNRLDPALVMQKLDEIATATKHVGSHVSCLENNGTIGTSTVSDCNITTEPIGPVNGTPVEFEGSIDSFQVLHNTVVVLDPWQVLLDHMEARPFDSSSAQADINNLDFHANRTFAVMQRRIDSCRQDLKMIEKRVLDNRADETATTADLRANKPECILYLETAR